MRQRDAAALLAGSGVDALGPTVWADLGCGDGTFTLALAGLLAPGSTIHAIDVDRDALRAIPHSHDGVHIRTHHGDFTAAAWPFARPDGILMANSLHYVDDQKAFVRRCESQLRTPPRFLIVEYDTDRANRWVPYPVSRARLAAVFAGYDIRILGSRPSVYQRATIYAAAATSGYRVVSSDH